MLKVNAYLQFEKHFNVIFISDNKKKELGAMSQT